jgi:hypothetical protein
MAFPVEALCGGNMKGGSGGDIQVHYVQTVRGPTSGPGRRRKKSSSASTPAAVPPPKYRGLRMVSASL